MTLGCWPKPINRHRDGARCRRKGGQVIAQGTVPQVIDTRESRIAPFLAQGGNVHDRVRDNIDAHEIFSAGRIHMETDRLHTVGPLSVDIPRGRLTAVTGVSGSGKTTMVLEMLMPALQSRIDRSPQRRRCGSSRRTVCPRHILSMPRLSARTYVPPSLHIAASMTIFDARSQKQMLRGPSV